MISEKLKRLFDDLQHEMDNGTPILVEGPEDKKALQHLGFHGTILTLSTISFSELAQKVAEGDNTKKIIILTDHDQYGETTAEKLRDFFLNECIQPELSFRRRFKKLTGCVEFEDLPSLIEKE